VPYDDAVAVIAVQSVGDFLGFNSHFHVIDTDPPRRRKPGTWNLSAVIPDQAQTNSASQCGTSASEGIRQLKYLSSMMSPHRPAPMII
jgi:hypothetical protein